MFVFKAAVVGAGVMGGEIAQVIAAADIPVLLKDVKQEFVDKGLEKAREVTEGQAGKLVKREKLTQEQADAQIEHTLGLITGTTDYDGFGDVDFVIEAVPEKMAIKHAGLRRPRRRHARPRDPRLQHVGPLDHRDRRHHQPAGQGRRLPLLLAGLLHAADRGHRGRGDLAGDAPGGRQLRPGDPQDARALRGVPGLRRQPHPHLDGVGDLALPGRDGHDVEDIDKALTEAKLVPMGPFFLADMSGLDTALKVARDMHDAYGDRFYVHQGMEELVEQGNLGQKSGKGFYEHS